MGVSSTDPLENKNQPKKNKYYSSIFLTLISGMPSNVSLITTTLKWVSDPTKTEYFVMSVVQREALGIAIKSSLLNLYGVSYWEVNLVVVKISFPKHK